MRPSSAKRREIAIEATTHEAERESNHGSNFSWTKSGLSSWGQCPTPSKRTRLTLGSLEGKVEKYLPTGPSIGVKGSWSPHRMRTGNEMFGISCTGFGPGGPVTMETKASRAPSPSAGSLIICSPVWREASWTNISRQLKMTWSIRNFHLPEPIRRPQIPYFHIQTVEYSSGYPCIGQKKWSVFALHGGLEETDFCSLKDILLLFNTPKNGRSNSSLLQ